MKRRCFGCMEMKNGSPVCEYCGYDERQENASHQLPVGTVLHGQYLIGKVLGQGGFGITYLGWDQNLDIPVAIKEFFPGGAVARDNSYNNTVQCFSTIQGAYGESKGRFLREAKTLAKFRDIPEIVSVQGFFEENNTAYIVMEYVRGTDLRRHIRNRGGKLSLAETLAVMKPVMEALAKVHESGVIHRDISPDNIMLLPNGRVKLLDFGAVRELHNPNAEGILTHSTEAILKRGFAPAEQYQRRGSLGPWTDIYALSATIYCCLTGKVPPESQELLMDGDRIHWETVPGLSRRQVETLAKATALLPKDRTASVKELYQGLYIPEQKPPILRQEQFVTAPVQNSRPVTFDGTGPVDRTVQKNEWQAKSVPQSNPQPKPTGNKHKLTAIVAAVLAVAVGAGIFFGGGKEKVNELPEVTGGITAQWETPEKNVLMENPVREENGDHSLEAEGQEQAFNTEAKRSEIRSITFFSDLSQVPENAADASKMQNGKVKAWAVKNEDLYDLYIAAKGGVCAPENASFLFAEMTELRTIRFSNAFFTENTQDMRYMFADCGKLETVDISCFDTSKVVSMKCMFQKCESLTKLDVSGFDTANVTDMSYMFAICSKLETLDVSGFDTAQVTSMDAMFEKCELVTSLDLRNFNTAKVTDMEMMFYLCTKLSSLDVRSFDTSKVTSMSHMFACCKSLEEVELEHFVISDVTDLTSMFYECPATVPAWYRRAVAQNNILMENSVQEVDGEVNLEAEKTESAFHTKAKRQEVKTITFLSDLSQAPEDAVDASQNQDGKVLAWVEKNGNLYDLYLAAEGGIFASVDAGYLFVNMTQLTQINFNDAFFTDDTIDMNQMFMGCEKLESLDVSGFNTSSAENMKSMFNGCAMLKKLDVSGFDTSKVTNMSYMFRNCTCLQELDLSGFDTGNVQNMRLMFDGCTSMVSLDVSGFDTSAVTDMYAMFSECTSLLSLDLSGFDTSNVTDMSFMFSECLSLTSLDISGFDTSNVTEMDAMFQMCEVLTVLDVSSFNTSKVTVMDYMFSKCKKVEKLDVSGFDTSNVTNMDHMFARCESLRELDLSNFDISKVTDKSWMFHGCPAPKPSWA